MNDLQKNVLNLIEYYNVREYLIDNYDSEKLESYIESLGKDADKNLTELFLDNSDRNYIQEILDIQKDFSKASEYLGQFLGTLEKYNRRLCNSCQDLWDIFEDNTTHHPRTMITERLELLFKKQDLI